MENLNFSQALEALKQGKKVKIKDWVDEFIHYVFLIKDNDNPTEGILDPELKKVIEEESPYWSDSFDKNFLFKSFSNNHKNRRILPYHLPDSYILCDDWIIVD